LKTGLQQHKKMTGDMEFKISQLTREKLNTMHESDADTQELSQIQKKHEVTEQKVLNLENQQKALYILPYVAAKPNSNMSTPNVPPSNATVPSSPKNSKTSTAD
jgi:hypothetical protein